MERPIAAAQRKRSEFKKNGRAERGEWSAKLTESLWKALKVCWGRVRIDTEKESETKRGGVENSGGGEIGGVEWRLKEEVKD